MAKQNPTSALINIRYKFNPYIEVMTLQWDDYVKFRAAFQNLKPNQRKVFDLRYSQLGGYQQRDVDLSDISSIELKQTR